jgi:hypothetical protein
MPRWEGPPKHQYSPERLAYLREANRRNRTRLRGGKAPMTTSEVARIAGIASQKARREKRRQEKLNALRQTSHAGFSAE